MEPTAITLCPGATTQWRPFEDLPDGAKVTCSTDSPATIKVTPAADGITITSLAAEPAYGPASLAAYVGDQRAHAVVAVVANGALPLWETPADEAEEAAAEAAPEVGEPAAA